VYQNRLAVRLKALGYELEYGRNLAIEVKGYTDEYRQVESPRRAEIQVEQERIGQFGYGASDNIALNTRGGKLDLTTDQVRALHREHAAAFGDQPQRAVEAARIHERVAYSAEYRTELAEEAIQFAKHRLSERTTVMEWHEIHRDALRFGRGYITLSDVEQAFARAGDRGEFRRVEHWRSSAPESRYTTPDLEEKEREILAWMANGRGRAGAIAGRITRDAFREQFRDHLNDGQKWLVWNLIHSDDRMVGVQGLAGTGKTRALATVQQFAEKYGYEVRGIAATSGAVAELRAVGIRADTLAGFALTKEKQLLPRTYLLDEASLTDVHQMSEFLTRLKPADRVVVIGDTRQHGSLGAGRVFTELQEAGIETFHLKKIVRQREESYREVVEHLSRGQIAEAIGKLEDGGRIHAFPDERVRYQAIAAWYLRDPQHTLVVSPDHRSGEAISEAIREARREVGQLVGESYRARTLDPRSGMTREDLQFAGSYRLGDVVVYARGLKLGIEKGDRASVLEVDRDSNAITVMRESDGRTFRYHPRRSGTTATLYEPAYREFAAGDRVQFTRALREDKIANRTLGIIEQVEPNGDVSIHLDDGRQWRGNLERMPHLDYGYVMTSYAAQGTTAERVLVHLDTDSPGISRMVNQQLIYVAASRGREDLQVFVNAREELVENLLRREEKATALAPEEVGRYRAIV
jgi:ATP-dependent exoDNAse (exonuclease V) alpha subunit